MYETSAIQTFIFLHSNLNFEKMLKALYKHEMNVVQVLF